MFVCGVPPSNLVNGGFADEGSLDVGVLYFGKAKPKRVSIPAGQKKCWLFII